jgi:hypothetical protein
MLARLILSAAILACSVTTAAEIPPRPTYPVKMDALSDDEFGRLFFAEVNLDFPGLEQAKAAVAKGDYPTALAAWAELFITRMQSLEPAEWSAANWFPIEEVMAADRVTMRHHGPVKDFGPPGKMDWHSPHDFDVHVNAMWHPKNIIRHVEMYHQRPHMQRQWTNAELYARWSAIWRDYVNNNWRIGMPLAFDHELRAKTLAESGLTNQPELWGSKIGFVQQLLVSWLLGNWFAQTQHGIQANREEFARQVPPRVLAEMVYFVMVWPVETIAGGFTVPVEGLSRGAPNQVHEKLVQLLRYAVIAPEFHRGAALLDLTGRLIKTILGVEGFRGIHSDCQADGSGTENSFNYMGSLTHAARAWLAIAETLPQTPDWAEPARNAMEMRRRFMESLDTPTGRQPLCSGYHGRRPPAGKPAGVAEPGSAKAYKSIAFPYHGLAMMRTGWGTDDLLLSLHNPRRGQGHGSDDGNKILLEAFGRYMLVANPGEGGWAGSSWSKCTISVDGLGQAYRLPGSDHGAYDDPQPGRWHSSPAFDFAEFTYAYGYGLKERPARGEPPISITDVAHLRQVAFAKDADLWFVIDVMLAPEAAEHDYEQLWHLHADFPKETVRADDAAQMITTTEAGQPNISIIQASATPLAYTLYHGDAYDPKAAAHPPLEARGWQVCEGCKAGNGLQPSPSVHATWRGRGRQTVVTALVPSRSEQAPVTASRRIVAADRVGLEITLADGRKATCVTSTSEKPIDQEGQAVHTVVSTTTTTADQERGLLLGPANTTGTEFERRSSSRHTTATITPPATFRWIETPAGFVPAYTSH